MRQPSDMSTVELLRATATSLMQESEDHCQCSGCVTAIGRAHALRERANRLESLVRARKTVAIRIDAPGSPQGGSNE